MHGRTAVGRFAVSALALVVFTVAACGDDDSNSGGERKADVAAAKQLIAPYQGQPSPFPVQEPLDRRPEPGTTVAFLDQGTPVTALQWDLIQAAAKPMGIEVFRVRGSGAEGISSAMDTIVERRPDGLIFASADPTLFTRQLEQLRKAGTTVVAGAIVNGREFGFETVQGGPSDTKLVGELMAAWALVRDNSDGEARDIVFYNIPELAYTKALLDGVQSKLDELCPDCKLRVVDIPLAEVGREGTDRVVSDLQAHPDTDFALFSGDEMQLGLPAALKTAGIDIPTLGGGPTPGNLEAIKNGEQDATLGSDFAVMMWTMVDQVAREMAGQELTGPQADGTIVKEFLTRKDIGFDPSRGWTGYPDFAERFAKLWNAQGRG